MSDQASAWAWRQQPNTTSQKLVLMALADRADEDGECWPSLHWISVKCAPMPERTVRRVIAELAEQGFVGKFERRRRGDGTLGTWIYRLAMDESPPATSGQWSPPATSGRTDLALPDGRPSVEADASTALAVIEGGAPSTQTLIGEIVDDARELGLPLPKRVVGQLAKNIKILVDEGYTLDQIKAGVARMMERRVVQPAMLANFVTEAALTDRAPAKKYGRRAVSAAELDREIERLEKEQRESG